MQIKTNNLKFTYFPKAPNAKEALKGISIEIEQGSFVAFVGETGSGKSTLMQCFNHLLIPSSGTIQIDDLTIRAKKRDRKINKPLRKKVGFVFQFPEYQLFEETVLKDVCYGPKNFGFKEEAAIEKAKKALDIMGIDESFYSRSPFELSGGEKKRVAIAGILASEPDIIVFDEPTVGMDPIRRQIMINLFDKLHADGKTIILVSHDMDLVLKSAEKVYVLQDGLLKFEGKPYELFAQNDNYGIEAPKVMKFAKELNSHGYNLDLKNIKDVESLVKEIGDKKNG